MICLICGKPLDGLNLGVGGVHEECLEMNFEITYARDGHALVTTIKARSKYEAAKKIEVLIPARDIISIKLLDDHEHKDQGYQAPKRTNLYTIHSLTAREPIRSFIPLVKSVSIVEKSSNEDWAAEGLICGESGILRKLNKITNCGVAQYFSGAGY